MIILPQIPEVLLEQEVKLLKTQNILQEFRNNRYDFDLENNFNYSFKRSLNDDQFTISIDAKLLKQNSDTFWAPAININNDDDTIYNYSDRNFVNQMQVYQDGQFKLNKMILNQKKFSDLEMSAIGVDGGGTNTFSYQSLRTIAYWQILPLPKLVISDFDHVVHLKIPKLIHLKTDISDLGTKNKLYNNYYSDARPGNYQLEIKYLNFYLKPNFPSFDSQSKSLVDIYAYDESDEKNNFSEDISFLTNGNLKSTSVSSGLKTIFTYNFDPEIQYQANPLNTASYLGSIKSEEAVYYDYQKEDVIKGFDQNSVFNDLIPYNFSGKYHWNLNFNLNSVIKNFSWKLSSKFLKPLLHPTNGKITLDLKTDQIPKQKLKHHLTLDDLMIIRKHEDISLEGIERLG